MPVVILILIGALVAVGFPLWLHYRVTGGAAPAEALPREQSSWNHHHPGTKGGADGECCGLHEVCEKMADKAGNAAEYFDDEELDAYRGRQAAAYTEAEVDQFRDVMLTMRPVEVPLWHQSLQQRGIELPATLTDEMMLIISEI